eukprot:5508635-Amphidinium_carterae.2
MAGGPSKLRRGLRAPHQAHMVHEVTEGWRISIILFNPGGLCHLAGTSISGFPLQATASSWRRPGVDTQDALNLLSLPNLRYVYVDDPRVLASEIQPLHAELEQAQQLEIFFADCQCTTALWTKGSATYPHLDLSIRATPQIRTV